MSKVRNIFLLFLFSVFLVACGGDDNPDNDFNSSITSNGGTVPGGGGTPAATTVISLSLSHSEITADNPAVATARVTRDSVPMAGRVVTFSTTLGHLSPSVATGLTDADGEAQIMLSTGTVAGAGELRARIGTGETSNVVGFTMDGLGGASGLAIELVLESATPNTINASEPGKLVARVTGASSPMIVTFGSQNCDIPVPTAMTIDGTATVDIYAGNQLGADEVTATLSDGTTAKIIVVVGAMELRMGSGDPFVEEAELSLEQISAGGTASVSVDIIDDQGNPYLQPIEVNFTSTCASATIPTAQLSSPVMTNNGTATSTYQAQGCVNDDVITVTANAGGMPLSAQATINVLPASANNIEFVSATPDYIGIVGTGGLGGTENSTLVFKVVDTNGLAVNNAEVNFELNTNVGGLDLDPVSAMSNANGLVQTVVNSGTVATSVRVTASLAGSMPLISSQSSLLLVTTGLPDQDSFSLSADIVNPEAWGYDNITVNVLARLSDAFNNPVPDGTAVSFRTEGGQIEPGCITVDGGCSVVWTSQDPRPEGIEIDDVPGAVPTPVNLLGQKFGGRATITATAIGEESFPDSNGNGRFDEAEFTLFDTGKNVSGRDFDLTADSFEDFNEDNLFNPQQAGGEQGGELEELIDFNADGVFDGRDHKYNGVLCAVDGMGNDINPHCADGILEPRSTYIRTNLVLVMSGSVPRINVVATNDATVLGVNDPSDASVVLDGKSVGSIIVDIADLHNQPMPAGTVLEFAASEGSIAGPDTYVWPNDAHNGGLRFAVAVGGAEEAAVGAITLTVTTPRGVISSYILGSVEILVP